MPRQLEANKSSEDFLVSSGIPINEALPLIEAPDKLTPQSPVSVAQRSLVLGYITLTGFGWSGQEVQNQLEKWNLYNYASDLEKALLTKTSFTQQEKVNATWLPECIQSFAWGLGLVELGHFKHCDDNLVEHFPILKDPDAFIQGAALRPFSEIYFQSDLHYRLHWASRDGRLHKEAATLDEGLIRERRKAMDWMIGVSDDWDDMHSDT
jgi:hypothetical protein